MVRMKEAGMTAIFAATHHNDQTRGQFVHNDQTRGQFVYELRAPHAGQQRDDGDGGGHHLVRRRRGGHQGSSQEQEQELEQSGNKPSKKEGEDREGLREHRKRKRTRNKG